jgi:hypothetical protein
MLRVSLLAVALLVSSPAVGFAEWQIRPFLGVTFGGGTNLFSDLETAAGQPKFSYGISGGLLGEIFGVEADFARSPGFFEDSDRVGGHLVLSSNVTTVMGNVVIAVPRHMVEYTLRPYLSGGAGLIRPSTISSQHVFDGASNMTGINIGAGVTGFLTRRVGLNWDVRRFRTVAGRTEIGTTSDGAPQQLSFWRAQMALAFRY